MEGILKLLEVLGRNFEAFEFRQVEAAEKIERLQDKNQDLMDQVAALTEKIQMLEGEDDRPFLE